MNLMDTLHESGGTNTSIDDWFYKNDVLDAVEKLKIRYPNFIPAIDEIFGNLHLNFDCDIE